MASAAIPRPTSASSASSSLDLPKTSPGTTRSFGSQLRILDNKPTHVKSLDSFKKILHFKIKAKHATVDHEPKRDRAASLRAFKDSQALEVINSKPKSTQMMENELDLFREMKHRFLSFKKDKYLENLEHFENLAKCQKPKFMVIACADSRVCPSSILGFQPGEAFVVRNVANLVPPYQNGPTETNAALEFAVNSLEVENILIVGHSCCGGIRALMSMEDEKNSSSFITKWVRNGKHAKLITSASASNLDFDQQCRHCEKVSINHSLRNLLTYPWIQEKVSEEKLLLHGGYYDFVNCTFEKWTLDDHKGSDSKIDGAYPVRNREFWC